VAEGGGRCEWEVGLIANPSEANFAHRPWPYTPRGSTAVRGPRIAVQPQNLRMLAGTLIGLVCCSCPPADFAGQWTSHCDTYDDYITISQVGFERISYFGPGGALHIGAYAHIELNSSGFVSCESTAREERRADGLGRWGVLSCSCAVGLSCRAMSLWELLRGQ
jgi:hypothetical protein